MAPVNSFAKGRGFGYRWAFPPGSSRGALQPFRGRVVAGASQILAIPGISLPPPPHPVPSLLRHDYQASSPVRGHLLLFQDIWGRTNSAAWAVEVVLRGYYIEFSEIPNPFFYASFYQRIQFVSMHSWRAFNICSKSRPSSRYLFKNKAMDFTQFYS